VRKLVMRAALAASVLIVPGHPSVCAAEVTDGATHHIDRAGVRGEAGAIHCTGTPPACTGYASTRVHVLPA
jgi:hypothetical protein